MDAHAKQAFRNKVWRHYRNHGRVLPWRQTDDPYRILVSEIMLQQTQVDRVAPKYEEWLKIFPDFTALAEASLREVLTAWQGLGYNRRAQNLQRCAKTVVATHGGVLPKDEQALQNLPGIGPYTASAIRAFAYNQPVVMIETNIRTVYLHHFFADEKNVSDQRLLPLIADTASKHQSRKWYWALMDYGSHLKKEYGNPNRNSSVYTKQSTFVGSNRQVRGRIIAALTTHGALTYEELTHELQVGKRRTDHALAQLEHEGIVSRARRTIRIAE